jgi:hypothetical protein
MNHLCPAGSELLNTRLHCSLVGRTLTFLVFRVFGLMGRYSGSMGKRSAGKGHRAKSKKQ